MDFQSTLVLRYLDPSHQEVNTYRLSLISPKKVLVAQIMVHLEQISHSQHSQLVQVQLQGSSDLLNSHLKKYRRY